MGIRYIDGRRLKKIILAGAHKVIASQEKINEINVFPVPDGDTGSNMASTFESISDGAMDAELVELEHVSTKLADSAMNGARGNSGAILAQFFQGLADGVGKKTRLTPEEFSVVVNKAARSAREAIAEPVEGTIITVMHDWAQWIKAHCNRHEYFETLLYHSLDAAKKSLKETTNKLEALRKAKVVDAGAQGFVHFLQGIADFIKTGKVNQLSMEDIKKSYQKITKSFSTSKSMDDGQGLQLSAHATHGDEMDFQYCTECIIHGENIDLDVVKAKIRDWGNSIVVVGNSSKVKIHIHSNDPERFFNKVSELGEILETKADDMWAQYRNRIGFETSKEIALVVDSSCCLPSEFAVKHNVITVPLQVSVNNKNYLDRINLSLSSFNESLKDPKSRISTSQPLPNDYCAAYDKGLRHAKSIIGIFLSGKLSGTYGAACKNKEKYADEQIQLFDSKNVAAGMGLIVQVAAEAIHAGLPALKIQRRIETAIKKTRSFVSPATLDRMIRGGRVNEKLGRAAKFLRVLPLIGLDEEGKVCKLGVSLGVRNSRKKMLKKAIQHAADLKNLRVIVNHADSEEVAKACAHTLEKALKIKDIPVVPISPLLLTHTGTGALSISVLGFEPHEDAF